MHELPDIPAIRIMAAREAVARLGLLKPAAEPTIVTLLENLGGDHPRTAVTAWRKAGEQLSAEEKRMLGIRANAFFSRQALEALCDKGFADPTKAHVTTLLRASFVLSRHRDAVSYRKSWRNIRRCEWRCDTTSAKAFTTGPSGTTGRSSHRTPARA